MQSTWRSSTCRRVAVGRGSLWSGCWVWTLVGQTLQPGQTSEARREGRECVEWCSPSCGCGSGRRVSGAGWSSRKPERSGTERRLPSGRGAGGWTQDAERRRGMHALDGLGRAKGAGTGAALPKAGGCRRRSMRWTVAVAPLAARPERRPRAPGRAWSEGHLCAAADSPGN